ncbi:hypothetical protein GCM10010103_76550 [Streptomyces paradoxus]|uniref:Uncharacterized protein n=1 Tax=Streptomyces paradoxus TaxID=66375 RepID=A0A7W9TJP7_9ACTN|nr:hypothetical protein [Streptomyces paradoxus]
MPSHSSPVPAAAVTGTTIQVATSASSSGIRGSARANWRAAPVSIADPGASVVDLTIVRLGLEGRRREVAEVTRWQGDDPAGVSSWSGCTWPSAARSSTSQCDLGPVERRLAVIVGSRR